MRTIEKQMLQAIQERKNWRLDNTSVHVNADKGCLLVRLHGNLIAIIWPGQEVTLSDCGWRSPTTKSRLNALASYFELPQFSTKKGQWYCGNKLWIGKKTFSLEHQPREFDAVLGGNCQQPRAYDAVLGGK